jgi:hypothetical protein
MPRQTVKYSNGWGTKSKKGEGHNNKKKQD